MRKKNYLHHAYSISEEDPREIYAKWANTYDEEITENGYATPGRIAKAVTEFIGDFNTPILDYGCGTGLSGIALKNEGFETIHGIDICKEMLEIAKKKSVYSSLKLFDPQKIPPVLNEVYKIIIASGVIGIGAAPPQVFDSIMGLLQSGGLFAFSFNDHTLKEPIFEKKIERYLTSQKAKLLFSEYGPHLPRVNINSNIYVLIKL